LLVGSKEKNGLASLLIIDRKTLYTCDFDASMLQNKGWPSSISMAAYHSGLLILIDDLSNISYFLIDRVASTIRKVELNGPRNVDKIYAVNMSKKYVCFAANGSVLVYLRQDKDLYF
jgi:hypothetical protein